VYSVKLKLEFTILNQLMNLVKGNLRETTTPHTGSKSYTGTRATGRSVLRSGTRLDKDLVHGDRTYSRMEDGISISRAPDDHIRLQELKNDGVLKTTTTEVRFDRAEDMDSVVSSPGPGLRRSSSSEIYIIEHNK
jgi:hypothetical protein